ncbi:MAG: hypothetical protein HY752_00850 [Nitrospirae bacterium]|nr:hypothetical protein [Nitrospirota bacterium]
MNESISLIGTWKVESHLEYIIVAIICALGIRIILSILQSIENSLYRLPIKAPNRLLKAFWYTFRGYPPCENNYTQCKDSNTPCDKNRFKFCQLKFCGDYWQAFALGILELCTFPILMRTENWYFIGAWIGFKVLGNWEGWKKSRQLVNRFLIGTGLILVVSLLIMVDYVSLIDP